MEAYAEQILDSKDLDPAMVPSQLIRAIAQGSEPEALGAISELQSKRDPQSEALVGDDGFIASAEMLARNFILVALLEPGPGERRLLKYRYEGLSHGERDSRSRSERLLESFGWRPTTFEIDVPSFSDCESFHFEVTAPDGIELIDIVLGDEHPSRRSAQGDVEDKWALGHNEVLTSSPHLAHLSTSRTSDTDATPDEFIDPRVSVRLRVARGGWLRSSALASVFVAIFLVASLPFVLGWDANDQQHECWYVRDSTEQAKWQPSHDGADVEDSASRLTCEEQSQINTDPAAFAVALLGVISLAVIRAGEHAYTARLLRRLRFAALTSAVLPIGAAWLLVFPGPSRLLSVGWVALVVTSVALAFVLVAVWLAPAK